MRYSINGTTFACPSAVDLYTSQTITFDARVELHPLDTLQLEPETLLQILIWDQM